MAGSGAVSLIIASYNHSDILAMTLAAAARQTHPELEVIIADDGSEEGYRPLLEETARWFAHGIQHVKHADQGFRKTRILNRAVHVSRFDALLFLDMDCLPHEDFVKNHLAYLGRGMAVTGRRVHIEKEAFPPADEILKHGLDFTSAALLRLWLAGQARRIEHGFRLPLFYATSGPGILGSNFSVHKADLQAINGFNEEYQENATGEDTDLDFRLRLAGVRVVTLRNRAIQYHVAHPMRPRTNGKNRALLERTMAERRVRAAIGLAEIQPRDFSHVRYGG
ncbi:MAG: glycosyltransferase [Candidatus Acidiferrales bacterium]